MMMMAIVVVSTVDGNAMVVARADMSPTNERRASNEEPRVRARPRALDRPSCVVVEIQPDDDAIHSFHFIHSFMHAFARSIRSMNVESIDARPRSIRSMKVESSRVESSRSRAYRRVSGRCGRSHSYSAVRSVDDRSMRDGH